MTSTELFRLGVPMSYASTVTRLFPCTYNINVMNIILITIIIYIDDIILTNTLAVIHENYHNYSDHHKYHNYISHIYYQTCQNLTHRTERRISWSTVLFALTRNGLPYLLPRQIHMQLIQQRLLWVGNWALGIHCFVVTQANYLHCSVCNCQSNLIELGI